MAQNQQNLVVEAQEALARERATAYQQELHAEQRIRDLMQQAEGNFKQKEDEFNRLRVRMPTIGSSGRASYSLTIPGQGGCNTCRSNSGRVYYSVTTSSMRHSVATVSVAVVFYTDIVHFVRICVGDYPACGLGVDPTVICAGTIGAHAGLALLCSHC